MLVRIVSNEAEYKAAHEEAEQLGLLWAAESNTGLQPGQWRLTFLPKSAFKDAPND